MMPMKPMMSERTRFAALLVATSLIVGTVYGDQCGGAAEAKTGQSFNDIVVDQLSQDIEDFGTSFSDKLEDTFTQIIDAIAVATKQESLGGSVVAEAHRQAGETAITATKAQQANAELLNAVINYAPVLGQGYDPCGTLYKNKSMAGAYAGVAATARAKVASLDVAPGRLVQNVSQTMQQRLALHREKFCTKAEAGNGLCRESSLPGGDVNAALLFEPAPSDSLQAAARTAYIQNVVGTPNPSVQPEAGGSSNGQNYQVSQNRLDAMHSASAYSLAVIDARNTQSIKMSGGSMQSPNEMLKLRVDQYFGGPDAQNWSKALMAQSQRGLTVEATKMAGLSVWMEHEELKNIHRMNVLYANILLSSADTLRSELGQLHQDALSNAASGSIR